MSNQIIHIDIIVPTYNRPTDLEKFLFEIKKQTYQNYKVFVIDDCSDFEIKNLIPQSSNFIYNRLDKNSGQAQARNYAVSLCKGDLVIFMDDDAWFLDVNALENIVKYFTFDQELGGLMFDIKEPNRRWLSERHNLKDRQEIGEFIACGCAFRLSEFRKTSGFRKEFHSYGEETDLTLQLIKIGSKIKFGKSIKVFHNYNPAERSAEWLSRFKFNSVRNDLYIVLTRFPLVFIFPYFFVKTINHSVYSIKNDRYKLKSLRQIIKASFGAVKMFKIKQRSPVSTKQFYYWLNKRF